MPVAVACAVAVWLLSASPALAGTASVKDVGGAPQATFQGGGEVNNLSASEAVTSSGIVWNFSDSQPIGLGPGCTRDSGSPNTVATCDLGGFSQSGAVITLGGGNDSANTGGSPVHVLSGEDGDDTLTGMALDGGPGNDHLNGVGSGFSGTVFFVEPGDGTDVITGSSATDALDLASPGTLDMRSNPDTITNVEELVGSSGDDTIIADDRLINGRGWAIFGGDGNDRLVAGAPGSNLDGGNGDDQLVGGPGIDSFDGGAGQDTLRADDGNAEDLFCGDDVDRAVPDALDTVHSDCELVGPLDPTSTSVSCPGDSNHPADTGVPINCDVLVADTCVVNCSSSPPTGSVTFAFADGTADPGCTLSPATIPGDSTCQVSVTASSDGTHAVSAAYLGDINHDASNGTGSFTSGDHYQIELKAWIPQDHVVDPNIPFQVPYPVLAAPVFNFALTPPRTPCYRFPLGLAVPAILVSSQFRGDDHAAYDGSFRVRPVADFDLKNGKITNFTVSDSADSFGVTSLDYTFRALNLFVLHQCSQQTQQVAAAGGQQLSDTSFELSISADDPLVQPRGVGPDSPAVPNIDSMLVGSFDSQGNLTLTATHDLFPSHGLRVIHNGVTVETKVTNDVSCLAPGTVEGFLGVGLLGYSLSQSQQDQPFTVPQNHTDTTVVPAPSCSSTFFTIDFFSLGEKSLFTAPDASEASATSRLRVAPQRGAHAGQFLPLQAAVDAGLITSYDAGGGHLVLGINPAEPVLLKTRGAVAITSTEITDGKAKTSQQFGPLSGNIELRLTGERANVTDNGKQARSHKVDTRPPRTTAKIVTHGKTATVTVTARDRGGVKFTIVTAGGKRIKLQNHRFKIATRKLRTVRVFSVDTFDNTETPHRLRR